MKSKIFKINQNLALAIAPNGDLILQGREEYNLNLNIDVYFLYLLPLLECNKEVFFREINQYENVNRLKLQEVINNLIKLPFNTKDEYWAEKALNWIDKENILNYPWLEVIDCAWMPQKLMHRVWNLRSQLKR